MLCVMNSTKRLIFGLVSTFLLAAGLARAADRFDPMSQSLRPVAGDMVLSDGGVVPPCTMPCVTVDGTNK